MRLKAEVIAAEPTEFNTKRGRVATVTLTVIDRDGDPMARLKNSMDYQLNQETDELQKYRDVKPGQGIELAVTGWQAGFAQQGGRYRLQGHIVSVAKP